MYIIDSVQLLYKGMIGEIGYDDEYHIYRGKIINTTHSIQYEGETIQEAIVDFKESIDELLELCKEKNISI